MALWEVVLVLGVALGASLLALVSGFGLGTLLLPAFALVFPLDVAVAATAVVHLANNVWKGGLLWPDAEWTTVAKFGIAAAVFAIPGAWLLIQLEVDPVWTYQALGRTRAVTPIGLVLGLLILGFALFELVPQLRKIQVGARWLIPGGAASGFFGGLSGHQGALRSVFLTKLDLGAKGFVATASFCAILVDVTRLVVYGAGRWATWGAKIDAVGGWGLIGGAVAMALLGAVGGKLVAGKITFQQVRIVVGILLVLAGLVIASGFV